MITKNHFLKDFKNPIFLGLIFLLFFLNIWGAIVGLVMHVLYVIWRSNTIKITEKELISEYPNWIFWNRVDIFELAEIERIEFEHSVQGAYATVPYFDVYLKNKKKTRIPYTPSITKDELEKLISILKTKLGIDKVS